jgi:alanyl-tRNA synthetase
VLRRILRRAVRHAWLLGRREPTLTHVVDGVIDEMADVYAELRVEADHIRTVTRVEEERFLDTIDGGLRRLDELMAGAGGTIGGGDAFRLHDTYGFPLDLTQLIAAERGYGVDVDGFNRALERQRMGSQAAATVEVAGEGGGNRGGDGGGAPAIRRGRNGRWITVTPRKRQRWVGYDTTRAETAILKFRRVGEELELLLHDNPFYAPGGGQVADTGQVEGEGWRLEVGDVRKVDGKSVVVGSFGEEFEPTPVVALVDRLRRENIERNHTATHLVHAALHRVLGPHARQAGSVVAPDRLRFDFTHHGPLSEGELKAIEEEVNAHVWENLSIETRQMSYQAAIEAGAMALFGEKYGDLVRVVEIPGVSLELCGGTHVDGTGTIGIFRFTHETGVAAGVRRVEALTGPGAYAAIRMHESWLREAADLVRSQPDAIARRLEAMLEEQRRLERQVAELLRSGGAGTGSEAERTEVGDVTILVDDSPVDDRQQVALLMDAFRERNRRGGEWGEGRRAAALRLSRHG